MKLSTAWNDAAKVADKSSGEKQVDLRQHLEETNQMHLPQAEILLECLGELKKQGLIEEAYLRGSLGRGHGHENSDIDLFTVIKPENVEKAYDVVTDYIKSKGEMIIGCHDRLVEDYGGIGFMFTAQSDKHNKIYQMDFYMAIKGLPPKQPFSIRPRIYAKDPSYCWLEEYGRERDMTILPPETKAFLAKHTDGSSLDDKVELIMEEALLSVFVANKHMKQGQTSRVIIDNQWVTSSAIELLQVISGYGSTGYSAIYLGNEIADFCRKNGDEGLVAAANTLDKLFTQPMDRQKLRDVVAYFKDVMQQGFPERYERHAKAIEIFQKQVLAEPKPAQKSRPSRKRQAGGPQ
jgi:predicted nucleotidyltransferase